MILLLGLEVEPATFLIMSGGLSLTTELSLTPIIMRAHSDTDNMWPSVYLFLMSQFVVTYFPSGGGGGGTEGVAGTPKHSGE